MIKYKYEVVVSNKFKQSLKKLKKQRKNIDEMLDIIYKLSIKEELDPKYRNHQLVNDKHYKDCYECHIRPDWLLVYKYDEGKLLLLLINTCSYSEVF